jgi:hypothetical protein
VRLVAARIGGVATCTIIRRSERRLWLADVAARDEMAIGFMSARRGLGGECRGPRRLT